MSRISVFTEKSKTKIGLIKPAQMLLALSLGEALKIMAMKVEQAIIQMIDYVAIMKFTYMLSTQED